MSRRADRSALERRRALVAALIALAVGGCGETSDAEATRSAARRACRGPPRGSPRQLMRSWCPEAVAGARRRLTEARARGCVRHAWDVWLRELRRNGYDPTRVGR
jgi:hypothetical protein